MGKVAIVTDSNSGITQVDAKELGIFVLPMPFNINDDTFFEDIDLTQEQFYEKLVEGAEIFTSQPSPENVMKLWDEVLKDYDEVVHIPMSSGLSGSCQTAIMLASEYEGKVLIGKYNVDDYSDLSTDYSIRNIPTILFFKDGELKERSVGSIKREELDAKIKALL